MEISNELQKILAEALKPFNIRCYESKRGDSSGKEYVIYDVVSSNYTTFADDIPTLRRYYADVKYFADKKSFKHDRLAAIEKAMREKGWLVSIPDTKIPTIEDNQPIGYLIEFNKDMVI